MSNPRARAMVEILREIADRLEREPNVTVADAGGLTGVLVTLLVDSGVKLEAGLDMIRHVWPKDNEPN